MNATDDIFQQRPKSTKTLHVGKGMEGREREKSLTLIHSKYKMPLTAVYHIADVEEGTSRYELEQQSQ